MFWVLPADIEDPGHIIMEGGTQQTVVQGTDNPADSRARIQDDGDDFYID